MLVDGIEHRDSAVGSLEVNLTLSDLDLCGTKYAEAYILEQLLREAHHPVVVLVGDIDLHGRELGVVRTVHALVAEVTAELIGSLEATHNEAL